MIEMMMQYPLLTALGAVGTLAVLYIGHTARKHQDKVLQAYRDENSRLIRGLRRKYAKRRHDRGEMCGLYDHKAYDMGQAQGEK